MNILELKRIITEKKNSVEALSSINIFELPEELINEPSDRLIHIIQSEEHKRGRKEDK